MLQLPSGRLLRMYKNCVKQCPGFLVENLNWMMAEADKLGHDFGSPGRVGGICVDEMSIQASPCTTLQFVNLHFLLVHTVDVLIHTDKH